MSEKKILREGIYTALVTPFTGEGALDPNGLDSRLFVLGRRLQLLTLRGFHARTRSDLAEVIDHTLPGDHGHPLRGSCILLYNRLIQSAFSAFPQRNQ